MTTPTGSVDLATSRRSMVASVSRIFMNEQMHWTLEATCSECLRETTAPLIVGAVIDCSGCGLVIKIDPGRTVFHRAVDHGRALDPRLFRPPAGLLPGVVIRVRRG